MKPQIEALTAFVRVVEGLSFTAAALSLGIPKSRVSALVSGLEAHLGTQLLYRTTRKVSLSHDGQVLYERARDLLSDLDELDNLFRPSPQGLSGVLHIDLPVSLAQNWVIPQLPDFLSAHPDLQIELSSTDRFVDVIAEGFDCVVRIGMMSASGLIARKVGELTLINVASPAYLDRFGVPESPDHLEPHYLVHYGHPIGVRAGGFDYVRGDKMETVAMKGWVSVNNSLAYQSAALAGFGIIQAPRIGLETLITQGRLVEILKPYRAAPMPVSLVYPRRAHQARRVRLFLDWISSVLSTVVDG